MFPRVLVSMSAPRIIHLHSVGELRDVADLWDDLWLRSEVTFPTMRAELLAQWMEQFAAGSRFHAIVVEHDGRWVAALPLLRRKIGRLIDADALPCNEWSSSGEFMLDPSADDDRIMDAFFDAIARCGRSLLWLDEAILEAPRWQIFMQGFDKRRIKSLIRSRW
jgi:hypothetical protein